jgi:hypothetical protein
VAGDDELRYSPSTVLGLADVFKRRPITSVAADLVTEAAAIARDGDELEIFELDIQGSLRVRRGV